MGTEIREFFGDLHVHIGRSSHGQPIKVTGARDLTFANIARECATRKGIEMVAVVDCASPWVLEDIRALIACGEMAELPGGGLRYRGQTTVILASELETVEPGGGMSHHICYFGTVEQMTAFSRALSEHVTNINLSSQSCRMPAARLAQICQSIGGIFVPAHAFTPHKSVFGTCTDRLERIFPERILSQMPAIELGLSADTRLADRIRENHQRTYLTNSDAHSLPKIAREYNILRMAEPSFVEFEKALWRREGRGISANYGLDPKLGKYHRTCCRECEWICVGEPPVTRCERCGSASVDMGVLDRIATIADLPEPSHPDHRPPYHYQVPLQFLPGIGTVALNKLLNRFGSEMAVLHKAPIEEIRQVVGSRTAARLMEARNGELHLIAGGGGKYGRVATKKDTGQLSLL